jgi:hypothetical protein
MTAVDDVGAWLVPRSGAQRQQHNECGVSARMAWRGLTTAAQPIAGQATLLQSSAYGIATKKPGAALSERMRGIRQGNGGHEVQRLQTAAARRLKLSACNLQLIAAFLKTSPARPVAAYSHPDHAAAQKSRSPLWSGSTLHRRRSSCRCRRKWPACDRANRWCRWRSRSQ